MACFQLNNEIEKDVFRLVTSVERSGLDPSSLLIFAGKQVVLEPSLHFYSWSAAFSLHFDFSLHFIPSLQSAFYTNR